jgi:predicted nuclease with TOPRIM domain
LKRENIFLEEKLKSVQDAFSNLRKQYEDLMAQHQQNNKQLQEIQS